MKPRVRPRRGVTLIELMVVVFIVALTLGLLLPALKYSSFCGCRPQCQNNMRQLGLALLAFSNTKGCFPNAGTIHDDPSVHGGVPAKSNIYLSMVDPDALPDRDHPLLSNWVIELLPYLDQPDIANAWNREAPFDDPGPTASGQISNRTLSRTGIGVLRCPEDPTYVMGQGNLSYVVNGGFARWYPIPVGWKGGAKDGTPVNGDVL